MDAIRELQCGRVVQGNGARQPVACALAGALLLAFGCAPTQTAADADPGPTTDARARTDAAPAPDADPDAPDAAPLPDAVPTPDAPPPADADTSPYRHTITIDGTNDFSGAADAFGTTSATYAAYVSWDDTNLYLGYAGDDIGSGDAKKWVLVFLDTDPGGATGALVGEQYNTQQPGFPSGFGAEYTFRWKASNDFQQLQIYGGSSWSDTGVTPTTYQSGTFVETAIPLSALGGPTQLGVAALMLNETDLAEAAYAGLYADSFTDGYYDVATAPIPLGRYLDIDFSAPRPPNDPANAKP